MVVSSAPQLASTYRLWHRFVMPVSSGQRDAVAVPNYVADQLSSAYTILVTSMVVNAWCICFALGFFYIMRHNKELAPLSSNLWNKRASMADSLMSLVSKRVDHWKRWWVYPAIFIILVCWVAQLVLSIVIPPLIFIDSAAPVNVDAILVPPNNGTTDAATAQLFSLDVPAALRAVGGALVAASDVSARVAVTQTDVGTTADFEPIQRIDYRYHVDGFELGLQHAAALRLSVQGSCRTEYGWLVSSSNASGYTNDTYAVFGNASAHGHVSLSLFDGPSPVAFFYNGPAGDGLGNTTWAAFVSSVDRVSYSPSTDAVYYTGSTAATVTASNGTGSGGNGTNATVTFTNPNLLGDTGYIVQARRPVLSCWESDVWSYGGANSTVVGLNSTALPGLKLPLALQLVFARYLAAPRIESIGTQLGLGALQSSTTALGTIFDAGSSSAFSDLQRLALAAYIATANTLTDTTLSPTYLGARTSAGNLVYGDDNRPLAGADAFVVWSSDVSTLSVRAAVVIPVLAAVSWVLVVVVLNYTPLATVNALDILELQKNIYEKYPDAHLAAYDQQQRSWNVPAVKSLPLVRAMTLPVRAVTTRTRTWGSRSGSRNNSASAQGGQGGPPGPTEVPPVPAYQPPAQPTYADGEKQASDPPAPAAAHDDHDDDQHRVSAASAASAAGLVNRASLISRLSRGSRASRSSQEMGAAPSPLADGHV